MAGRAPGWVPASGQTAISTRSKSSPRSLDEVQIVAALKKPLAILHGEHEQLVSLPYLQGVAAPTLWRGAVQLIADSGHAPHWEQPAAFNALLEAFIKDCSV